MGLRYLTDEENKRLDFICERLTEYRKQIEIDEAEKSYFEALRNLRHLRQKSEDKEKGK